MHCPSLFFFFNDTATTEIYTLSLHDALPIFLASRPRAVGSAGLRAVVSSHGCGPRTQNNSPGGLSSPADASPDPSVLSSGLMSSGPLFRTVLTAMDTGCDVRPPAIAGSIAA